MPDSPEKFLQKTGNYRALHAYRKAEVLYDFTFRFCEKFLAKGDRTRDQMIQAARSGKAGRKTRGDCGTEVYAKT